MATQGSGSRGGSGAFEILHIRDKVERQVHQQGWLPADSWWHEPYTRADANAGHSTALAMPFLLLPFRPASDPSAARTFIRNYFSPHLEKGGALEGESLKQELRLTEPLVWSITSSVEGTDGFRFWSA